MDFVKDLNIILNLIGLVFLISGIFIFVNAYESYGSIFYDMIAKDNDNLVIAKIIFFTLIAMILGYTWVIKQTIIHNFDDVLRLITYVFFNVSFFIFMTTLLIRKIYSNVIKLYFEIIKTFINIIEMRDEYTRGHSEHVASLVGLIYEKTPYKLKGKLHKRRLIKAALLHDIGKLMISKEILLKNGSLTDEEYEQIKMHTSFGVDVLKSLKLFKPVLSWIKYHHERVDGKGYYGLKDDQIPLEARIIAVADTYSAITTNRSYRSRRSYSEAAEILKEVSGSQLDKQIVDIFLNIRYEDLREHRIYIKNDIYKTPQKINWDFK